MNLEIVIAALALLVSGLAVFYTWRSNLEAKKANNISRLNALLALEEHYKKLMEFQAKFAKNFRQSQSGFKCAEEEYAKLDGKLREVNREIKKLHETIISLDD